MSKIEWCDKTWNPITGCSKISPACKNCYAEKMSKRLAGRFGYPVDDPFKPGTFHPDKLNEPLKWNGKLVFVTSMGDLFHDNVRKNLIKKVFHVISRSNNTFILLTKRPRKMAKCLSEYANKLKRFPPNIWAGITVESEDTTWRIDVLGDIPVRVKFISAEPLLSELGIMGELCSNGIDWVICGGETGPGARPMKKEWAVSLKDQCKELNIPFFFKSMGGKNKSRELEGSTYNELPRIYKGGC